MVTLILSILTYQSGNDWSAQAMAAVVWYREGHLGRVLKSTGAKGTFTHLEKEPARFMIGDPQEVGHSGELLV